MLQQTEAKKQASYIKSMFRIAGRLHRAGYKHVSVRRFPGNAVMIVEKTA